MKPILKLLYDISDSHYYIYYSKELAVMLFRVDNINPLNVSRVTEMGVIHHQLRNSILKEMEEFAISEFRKLEDGL